MTYDPTLVVFSFNSTGSELLPGDRPLVYEWGQGTVRSKTFARRGRPKKNANLTLENHVKYSGSGSTADHGPFEFVAVPAGQSHTDAATKSKIRSHAKRYCGSNPALQQRKAAPKVDNLRDSVLQCVKLLDAPLVSREFLSFDPFRCQRVQLQPYMLATLSKYTTVLAEAVWPIEMQSGVNPMRDYFLPLALQDIALFHAIMYTSETVRTMVPECQEVTTAIHHLVHCIGCVNERLRATEPHSDDATIIIIATMATSEGSRGNHKGWEIHMRGLKQLVVMRGGLKAFRSNRILYSKILRTDLSGSVDVRSPPYFDGHDIQASVPRLPLQQTSLGFESCSELFRLDQKLQGIVSDVATSTFHLNEIYCGDKTWQPLDLREAYLSHQYSLLRQESLASFSEESAISHVYRLALLLFTSSVLSNFPPGAASCNAIASALKVLVLQYAHKLNLPSKFQWWLVFLIGAMSSDTDNISWATNFFREVVSEDGYVSQTELKLGLVMFLWVEKVHDRKLQWLWRHIAIPNTT